MFVCKVCGHVHFGDSAPGVCPVCHAQAKAFTEDKEAVKLPLDADNLTEAERKHQPVITVQSGDGSQIINISQDILHPMEDDHWIMFLDLYVDGKYQSRTAFPPGSGLSPVVEKLWAQKTFEEVKAVACCNKHGRWAATLKQDTVEEGVYKCAGCGMTSTTKQHLCSPVKGGKTYVCSYCGLEGDDVRHVCKPKVNDMSYVCEACGRVAAGSDDLCMPNEIR